MDGRIASQAHNRARRPRQPDHDPPTPLGHHVAARPLATVLLSKRPLPHVRLRSSRHARPLPGVWQNEDHGMKRKLLTFFSFVSLLLCLAVCVLWVRSYRATDDVRFKTASAVGDWSTM